MDNIQKTCLLIWYIGLILNGIITYLIVGNGINWLILNITMTLVGGVPLVIFAVYRDIDEIKRRKE